MLANNNFRNLSETYLFAEVGRRVSRFKDLHPDREVIRMDIGDVTLPIISPVAEAMKNAMAELQDSSTFKGYGPEQGYDFLRNAISEFDYKARGVDIDPDEVFISDGAKCDIGNFTDLFEKDCVVGIPDPVYPVYVDSNIMAGRTVENGKLVYIKCDPQQDYAPMPPSEKLNVVYLCSPNNPTGGAMGKKELEEWVAYALANNTLLIFDSAYEAFIRDKDIPRSIYEIKEAKRVAVEIRSFSKTAGFTGLRCGYTVVPKEVKANFADDSETELRKLWLRRQTTKFNGASYIIQKGAAAIFTPEGKKLIDANIDYYLRNAGLLKEAFVKMGYETTGGVNSPYVWVKDRKGRGSWELFDLILHNCQISTTPGVGFGSAGEGCIRLTGFNSFENTKKAIERLLSL